MQEVLMKSFDVIVVGAGHNGLAASIKLAKTGRKVLLLETSSEPGGLAASKEVFNGFKTATLPHIINQLSSKAIRELDLLKYGLETKNYSIPTICIDHSGRYIQLSGNYGSEIEGISSIDQKNWINLKKRLTNQSSLLKRFIYDSPINKDNNKLLQKLKFLKAGIDLRLKGREEFQEFFRMILMCVADVLEEEINNDLLKGLLSFDATLGINLGPRSPTSLMGLLYKLSGEVNGEQSSQIFPKGGIEKLVDTFYKSAIGSGVEIIFGQEVKNLIIENNKIQGVKTINGKEYRANKVLSSVSPIKTFFEFIGHKKLDTGVLRELKSLRYKGNISKLLAIEGLQASHNFFNGIHFGSNQIDGEGLYDYLAYLDDTNYSDSTMFIGLEDDIVSSFENSMQKLLLLNDNFVIQIQADNIKMLEAYDAIQQAVVRLKTNMLSILGISVDYYDADGD